jgi:hypothetical protein
LEAFFSKGEGKTGKNILPRLALVVHACNPSYSGGRDQVDRGSKPAWANSSARLYFKKTLHQKGAGRVTQGVGSEFKPPYCKKKNSSSRPFYMTVT